MKLENYLEKNAEMLEGGILSLYHDIDEGYYDGKYMIFVNEEKETVVLKDETGNTVSAKIMKGKKDKFDARTGIGIVLLKQMTGLTNSRMEHRGYDKVLGMKYEGLALDLVEYLGLTEEFLNEIRDGKKQYKLVLEMFTEDDEDSCDMDADDYDSCEDNACDCCDEDEYDEDYGGLPWEDYLEEEYEEVDPLEKQREELEKVVDTIARALGVSKNDYEVAIGEFDGMRGVGITGTSLELEEALKNYCLREWN